MKLFDTCILGGGYAGLVLADRLSQIGYKNIGIIDSQNNYDKGGLLHSEVIDGYTFDTGGPHLLFSKDSEILTNILKFLGKNSSVKKRRNYVLYKGNFIDYPFENGSYSLNPEQRVKMAKDVIERILFISKNPEWRPKNFLEWITGFFGDFISKEYLIPYNEKIWKRPLQKMAADWVFIPGRLPFPNLEDILYSVAGIPNIGYKEQAFFYYPIEGGIASLYNSVFEKVKNQDVTLIYGERVDNVKRLSENKYMINSKFISKKLFSTIPLPELLVSLGVDSYNFLLSEKFDYNSVLIVGIALKIPTPNQITVYVPNPEIIFHRITWMSSLSPPLKGNGSNIIAEITIPKNSKVDLDEVVDQTIKGLIETGFIPSEEEILFTRVWFNKYGYPIYNLNHNEVRNEAMELISKLGIKSVGRWGSWHYWNTDMVFKAVWELQV